MKSQWLRYIVKNPAKYDGKYLYGHYSAMSFSSLAKARAHVQPGGFVLDKFSCKGSGLSYRCVYEDGRPFPESNH